MIKKTKQGYDVTSEKGKNLGGPYKSKAKAKKRLQQVEFFKHNMLLKVTLNFRLPIAIGTPFGFNLISNLIANISNLKNSF